MTRAIQDNNPEVGTTPLLAKEGSPRKRAGWLQTTRSYLIDAAKPPITGRGHPSLKRREVALTHTMVNQQNRGGHRPLLQKKDDTSI